MAFEDNSFGNAFQQQFKRGIGVGGEPTAPNSVPEGTPVAAFAPNRTRTGQQPPPMAQMNAMAPNKTRTGQQPPPFMANFAMGEPNPNKHPGYMPYGKGPGYDGPPPGLQQFAVDQSLDYPGGGLGGFQDNEGLPNPMPIPDGGPHWRNNPPGTGGFDPVGPGYGLGGGQTEDNGLRPMDPIRNRDPWAQRVGDDLQGLAQRGYYKDDNGNWQQNQNMGVPRQPQGYPPMAARVQNPGALPPMRDPKNFRPPPPMAQNWRGMLPGSGAGNGGFDFSQYFGNGMPQDGKAWNWGNLENLRNRRF